MFCVIKNLSSNKLEIAHTEDLYDVQFDKDYKCIGYKPFKPVHETDFKKSHEYAYIEGDFLYTCWILRMSNSQDTVKTLMKSNNIKNPKRQSIGRTKFRLETVEQAMETRRDSASAKKKRHLVYFSALLKEKKLSKKIINITRSQMLIKKKNSENTKENSRSSKGKIQRNEEKAVSDAEPSDHDDDGKTSKSGDSDASGNDDDGKRSKSGDSDASGNDD